MVATNGRVGLLRHGSEIDCDVASAAGSAQVESERERLASQAKGAAIVVDAAIVATAKVSLASITFAMRTLVGEHVRAAVEAHVYPTASARGTGSMLCAT